MAPYTTNFVEANGVNVFYREAGPKEAPILLLLHGFPTSSHQYRNLIPLLSHKYHIIAPDLPGFGFTQVPTSLHYKYTFSNLTSIIESFLSALSITNFSMYVFDYGAPVGFRLALRIPNAIQAIITQNGNAYEQGLGEAWGPIQAYWKSGSAQDREVVRRNVLTLEAIKWQYDTGSKIPIAPEAAFLDYALMQREGNMDVQLDLFYDYRNNVEMYPLFQEYFRRSQVPMLVAWGKHDPFFIPSGAEAFKDDVREAEVHLLDAGHLAVESDGEEIAGLMMRFLKKRGIY